MSTDKQIVFTQVSLFSVLLCGRYGGVTSIGDVKRMGDMAIATMDRLDGEMQMIDGVVYQARADGSIRLPQDEETIPFGTVAQFRPQQIHPMDNIQTYQDFEAVADQLLANVNLPVAVRVRGKFRNMKVRAVGRQENDGVPLAQAAAQEAVFQLEQSEGDLVGFRLPAYMKGINAPGWHLHYMDRERQHGGHVVNFDLLHGTLECCCCTDFQLHLPDKPAVFDGLDLGKDYSTDLAKAEAER